MKVLYIGKHGNGKNDDEGSITYSLERLGHTVSKMTEIQTNYRNLNGDGFDFCLFNHWSDYEAIEKIKIPKVFWYFDLIDYPDPTVSARCNARKQWMSIVTPLVDLGFCTDGDWVSQDNSGKLIRLTQGADPRILGRGKQTLRNKSKLLFTGMEHKCGTERSEFVKDIREKYEFRFKHISGMARNGIYGRKLADLIANTQIVICPDSPVTDNYWSNRVYNALGFGAFVLHPYCETLKKQYHNGTDLVMYKSMDDLHGKIEEYLKNTYKMLTIGMLGLETTVKEHTYIHRCETLINVVRERLGI